MSTTITIGRLTADPDQLRYAGEAPVLNASLAENHRVKVNGQWQDGPATFYRLNIWRHNAVNAAESLRKGVQVIVVGTQKTTVWTDQNGQERKELEIDVEHIGPSLQLQTTQVHSAIPGARQPHQGGFGGGASNTYDATQTTGWGQPAPPQSAAGQGGWPTDEPDF